jgi:hypothetical protein
MMRHLALFPLLAGTLFAAEETRRFEHTNEHFVITLTADWNEVDATNAPYARKVLGSQTNLTHAYQLTSETNFDAVVFVEIDEDWRISELELGLFHMESVRKQFLTALELTGLRVLDSAFYTNRLELRISATADYGKIGHTRQLIGWHFTEKGTYSVTCVAPIEHYKTVGPAFTKALDTFHIDASLKYRPRELTKDTSKDPPKVVRLRLGWVFGFGALVLFLCRRWFTRVNSDEV